MRRSALCIAGGALLFAGGILVHLFPHTDIAPVGNLATSLFLIGGAAQLTMSFWNTRDRTDFLFGLLGALSVIIAIALLGKPNPNLIFRSQAICIALAASATVRLLIAVVYRRTLTHWPILASGLMSAFVAVQLVANPPYPTVLQLEVLPRILISYLGLELCSTGGGLLGFGIVELKDRLGGREATVTDQ